MYKRMPIPALLAPYLRRGGEKASHPSLIVQERCKTRRWVSKRIVRRMYTTITLPVQDGDGLGGDDDDDDEVMVI